MAKAQILKIRKEQYNVQMRRGLISLAVAVISFIVGLFAAPTSPHSTHDGSTTLAQANTKRSAMSAQATPALQATDTPELQKFRDSWTDIVERTTSAMKAGDLAQKHLAAANPIDASAELKNCEDAASGIKDDASDLTNDDNSDLGTSLWGKVAKIGDGLGYGYKSLRQYLDTQAPSDAADAKSQLGGVPGAVVAAQYLAQEKYRQIGGDPAALFD